jgi:hypothetical protein
MRATSNQNGTPSAHPPVSESGVSSSFTSSLGQSTNSAPYTTVTPTSFSTYASVPTAPTHPFSFPVQTYTVKPDSDDLAFDLHFWLGQNTSIDEAGTAAYKTVELDDRELSVSVQRLLNRLPKTFMAPQFNIARSKDTNQASFYPIFPLFIVYPVGSLLGSTTSLSHQNPLPVSLPSKPIPITAVISWSTNCQSSPPALLSLPSSFSIKETTSGS